MQRVDGGQKFFLLLVVNLRSGREVELASLARDTFRDTERENELYAVRARRSCIHLAAERRGLSKLN